MTQAPDATQTQRTGFATQFSPAARAAWGGAVIGLVCIVLASAFPWLGEWPAALTIPASEWIGFVMQGVLSWLKPAARLFSELLAYPMNWANVLLVTTPWPIVIGVVTATGWYLGGWRMAALVLIGLSFVLASGYWIESMNTLALVAVSVPLALIAGLAIGVLAYEFPSVRQIVQAVLDVMQTVPTFAYLTPLLVLFGFGPVVGLIASAIYAAPPMARNVLLGLDRVDDDIKDAAVMSGGNRFHQLFLVELPSAATQIMVGVNQSLMAALSMVIIAAVIGGFNDIGWEVLLTMRKAQFGQSFLAGLVIVVFAMVIDRMNAALAMERKRHDLKVIVLLLSVSVAFTLLLWGRLPAPTTYSFFDPIAARVDAGLGAFTAANGELLDTVKNSVLFYLMLPLRIGLDDAVLPFTWGFTWTPIMSLGLIGGAVVLGAIGLLCAVSPLVWRIVRPICDMLQTIPLFVFLIPVLMLFQIGEFSAFLAICAYAVVPMIRYTHHGLINTPEEMVEAAVSLGVTQAQTMREVRIPYAIPTILLGVNQTNLYAFFMLVIAALIGTTGLGQSIYLALCVRKRRSGSVFQRSSHRC